MKAVLFLLTLLFWSVNVAAQTDLYPLFPDKEFTGWTRTEEPKQYRGEELFLMIDGGADIYHEYGFSQVLAGEYENEGGAYIRLEIYEMTTPEAAYGIYTFKTGQEGKELDIGQAALLEEYYLNIWKGNLLVTIAGSDTESGTIDAVTAFGRFIGQRYTKQGRIPELAELLISEPISFSAPTYVLGSIGAMNSYVFDTEDIFRVREGMIGSVETNKAFVFRYPDNAESTRVFDNITTRFKTSHRFSDVNRMDDLCTMRDRDRNFLVIRKMGQDIVTVIGKNRENVTKLAKRLTQKLNGLQAAQPQ